MAEQKQLFDDDTINPDKPVRQKQREGHAATPYPIGSGPEGETCRSCLHATKINWHDKTYYKCQLMAKSWTHGGASDIKLRWAACQGWDAKPK